jgi:hypothetical protein
MRPRRVGPAVLSGGDARPTAGDNIDVTAGPGLPASAETLFGAVAAAGRLTLVSPAGGPTIVTADFPNDGDQATRR